MQNRYSHCPFLRIIAAAIEKFNRSPRRLNSERRERREKPRLFFLKTKKSFSAFSASPREAAVVAVSAATRGGQVRRLNVAMTGCCRFSPNPSPRSPRLRAEDRCRCSSFHSAFRTRHSALMVVPPFFWAPEGGPGNPHYPDRIY